MPESARAAAGNALASWPVWAMGRGCWPPRAEQSSASADRRAVGDPRVGDLAERSMGVARGRVGVAAALR
jgi:hypothetical protein